jgi:hypothetical protein
VYDGGVGEVAIVVDEAEGAAELEVRPSAGEARAQRPVLEAKQVAVRDGVQRDEGRGYELSGNDLIEGVGEAQRA